MIEPGLFAASKPLATACATNNEARRFRPRTASPIRYIKNVKTPTFIFVGERDVECPAPQSMEFWHGLKEMGVPTTLMIYEGEGHGIRQPEHVKDYTTRMIGWFDKYLR